VRAACSLAQRAAAPSAAIITATSAGTKNSEPTVARRACATLLTIHAAHSSVTATTAPPNASERRRWPVVAHARARSSPSGSRPTPAGRKLDQCSRDGADA
jgi:hypothetical protein